MKDTMKPFRKAIYDRLKNNVVYKSTAVAIYDEKVFTGETPIVYILFGTQREQNVDDTDCAWETRSSIDILIISRTQSETSKDVLDDISNNILDLLLNLPGSDNLAAQTGFKIIYLKRESAVCGLLQISPTETILQKQLTLTATIIQN
jgi:hypothetical protein